VTGQEDVADEPSTPDETDADTDEDATNEAASEEDEE
jgi:hypothetical protein